MPARRKKCCPGGGSARGRQGPAGPAGPAGANGADGISADTPDEEALGATAAGETVTVLSVPMSADEVMTIGVRWFGWSAANNVLIHEATFVLKRTGGGAATEIGIHDNATVRDVTQVVGADSDYVPTATGVNLVVIGAVGTPMSWIVSAWFTHLLI